MGEALCLTAVAFQFLTRLPVPQIRVADGDLRRASAAFPLVGIVVAGIGIALRAGAGALWEPVVGTVAAVTAMVAVTGAFHEDGLADSADGLWGGWDPAQRIAIMRDSRIGTYGTVALLAVLALRVSLLAPLPLGPFAAAVLCGAVLGRASTLLLVRLLPASAAGSGAAVVGALGATATVVAVATVAVVLVLAAGVWSPLVLACGDPTRQARAPAPRRDGRGADLCGPQRSGPVGQGPRAGGGCGGAPGPRTRPGRDLSAAPRPGDRGSVRASYGGRRPPGGARLRGLGGPPVGRAVAECRPRRAHRPGRLRRLHPARGGDCRRGPRTGYRSAARPDLDPRGDGPRHHPMPGPCARRSPSHCAWMRTRPSRSPPSTRARRSSRAMARTGSSNGSAPEAARRVAERRPACS
jgi:adenosylcobinamide-GDP ribazoletransferase